MRSFLKFLSRNKLYTAIEAVGLAVGLAFVILIGSYVVQQYEVAHENPDYRRVFTVGSPAFPGLGYWDKEEIETGIPEVEAVTHVCSLWQSVTVVDGEAFSCSGMEADPKFFDVFPEYCLTEGDTDAFDRRDAMLVSESFARRISKEGESPVGRTVRCDDEERVVTGVFRDFDGTFFMPCDVITNISSDWAASQQRAFNSIGGIVTWYRIGEGVSRSDADAKVMALVRRNYVDNWGDDVESWRTWRMDEAFFAPGRSGGLTRTGSLQMLRLLTAVVLLLLLSAVFNYVNLSFALTVRRSREMATRRLLGADRGSILRRYMGESIVFTAVCFGAALLLAYLFQPMINSLVSVGSAAETVMGDISVGVDLGMTPLHALIYVAAILLTGALCGLLPAWTASGYAPIDVVRGSLRRRSKMVFSRIFIVVQNVLAVFLIAVALVMEAQMHHMLSRPTHSAVDNLWYMEYSATQYDQMSLLKDKVERLPFVTGVGVGRGVPGHIQMSMGVQVDERHVNVPVILCDTTYFRLLGLEIEEDFGAPLLHSIWLSRSAFNELAASDTSGIIAHNFDINGASANHVGGIVTDFPTGAASAREANPNGAVIVARPEEMLWAHCLLVGTTGEDKSYGESIMGAYREYRIEQFGVEEEAWTRGFMRDLNVQLLEPERRTMRLVELFTFLSVLISLLGLLAMSTYFADESTRQIAVRKVFGGDVTGETLRAMRAYMMLSAIACIIGIPLAVWASGLYLERFAWRIYGYGWLFAVAAVVSLAVAFLSVLWQTLSAAKTNPATELKKE